MNKFKFGYDWAHLAHFSIENTSEMIFWVRPDGSFFYVNPAVYKTLGYTPLDLSKLKAQDILVDYDHGDRENLRKKIDDTGKYIIRVNLLKKDGTCIPVESINNSIKIDNEVINCAFVRDISDQVKTELDLKETQESLKRENEVLRSLYSLSDSLNIIGSSKSLIKTLELGRNFALSDLTVLINGESGVGKESMAKFIHLNSNRRKLPIITVNCATLTSNDVISKLFGHVKGAFTGAHQDRQGLFALANESSLFLDEVGELSLEVQAMLLRVIQSKEFTRMGDKKVLTTNARIIAATNRNLREMVSKKEFREDLLYRLDALTLKIPPLRERTSDLLQLIEHKLALLNKSYGLDRKMPGAETLATLKGYSFPGNIRELFNLLERAYFSGDQGPLRINRQSFRATNQDLNYLGPITTLKTNERNHILRALEHCNWKVSGKGGASELLGVNRSTLNSKMKLLNISR
jgi:PAS domain S-box-containing protein